MTTRTTGAPRQVIALDEFCYLCGKPAVGYREPFATATASLTSEPLRPVCSEHGSFVRPAMDHRLISTRRGLKVKCGQADVATIHWDDLAALKAKPKSGIELRTIPLRLVDPRA